MKKTPHKQSKTRGRTDNNQTEIVKGLRAHGFSVLILSDQGDGCPDLLVGGETNFRMHVTKNLMCHGRFQANIFMEVKGTRGKLTPDQKVFQEKWMGQYDIVRTLPEALILMGTPRG